MRISNTSNNRLLEELKKKHKKESIRVSKELFEKANGLNRDVSKIIIILKEEVLSLDKSIFESQNSNFKNSFINYQGIFIAKDSTVDSINKTLDEIEEQKQNDIKNEDFFDFSKTAKERGYQIANSGDSNLQKLYQKLKEYEKKVAVLTKKLASTDNPIEANAISEKINELNEKISAIKEQIQGILRGKG